MLTNQTTRRDRVMGWLTLPKVITMLLKVLMMSERIFVSQLCYRSQQYVVRVSKLSNLARCNLKHKGDKRQFFTCQRQCPNSYPWVNNLNGNWAPRLAVSNNGILDLVAKMFNFREELNQSYEGRECLFCFDYVCIMSIQQSTLDIDVLLH